MEKHSLFWAFTRFEHSATCCAALVLQLVEHWPRKLTAVTSNPFGGNTFSLPADWLFIRSSFPKHYQCNFLYTVHISLTCPSCSWYYTTDEGCYTAVEMFGTKTLPVHVWANSHADSIINWWLPVISYSVTDVPNVNGQALQTEETSSKKQAHTAST